VRSTYEIVDYNSLPGVPCPCGTARRGLMEVASVPYSLHVTNISADAATHYHKRLTETYFILECQPDAYLELNGERLPVRPHMAVLIHPLTRHRAVGKMRVLIVASPKFDPTDEWFD
jgi:mannose-6-phosphate isomerase-like protein (cupin superfamily)